MKLTRQKQSGILELKIDGRIDAQWSEHFSDEIEDVIRNGHHDIHLDMQKVTFMSSAGIRVLMLSYKQLTAINGSLSIINPSDAVKNILEMSGLMEMFNTKAPASEKDSSDTSKTTKGHTEYETFKTSAKTKMTCRIIGNPQLLADSNSEADSSSTVPINKSTLSLGLGAFGADHESCKDLFGEFIAVAGTSAYLPPTSGGAPDYLLSAGSFTPEVQMLYAAVCEGEFSDFIRFETDDSTTGVTMSDLAESLLEISGHKKIAIAMLAESAGLIGASIRRSPAKKKTGENVFSYPDIRQWLSFSPERVFDRSLALVVGILSIDEESKDDFLRPLGKNAETRGHIHAASFSYAPITRGLLNIDETLATIFKKETLQGVMHLLPDDRDSSTVLESEFKRGAVWIGGIE